MNAKIRRMSRRRAKKAVMKIYKNLIHAYLSSCLGRFEGNEINNLTIDEIKTVLKSKLSFYKSIKEDISEPNSILVTVYSQLESINFYQPPVRLEVQP